MRANRSRKHRIEVAMNDQEYEEFMKHIKMIFKKSFVN